MFARVSVDLSSRELWCHRRHVLCSIAEMSETEADAEGELDGDVPGGPDAWELANLLQKEDEAEKKETPKWKKYARLILPHVGLIVLSLGYIVAGAGVFYLIEEPNEVATRAREVAAVDAQRRALLAQLWTLSLADDTDATSFTQHALLQLDNVTRALFQAFDTHYVSAEQVNFGVSPEDRGTWTFAASVFFTSTLLTTIGYGNLVPVTFHGRIFCICYGLFGVPLILITVADIGKFLSEHIVWLYCRYLELKRGLRRRRRGAGSEAEAEELAERAKAQEELEKFGLDDYISIPVSLVLLILVGYIAAGAVLLSHLEEWNFFSAFYFSFITMTTVGFGDIVPEKEAYFMLHLLYIIIGLAITTMCIDLVGIQYIRKIHYFGRAIQDARYALVNVGGRMVQVGDLMKYASVLQKKYGLGEGGLEGEEGPSCFVPKEIKYIRYIDYLSSTSTSAASLHTLASQPSGLPSGLPSRQFSRQSSGRLHLPQDPPSIDVFRDSGPDRPPSRDPPSHQSLLDPPSPSSPRAL